MHTFGGKTTHKYFVFAALFPVISEARRYKEQQASLI
jgi:hypothetical protein